MNLDFFPPFNAALNGIAGLCLIAGFVLIKQGKREAHAKTMIAALAVSAIFLVSYVTSKILKGNVHTTFPDAYPTARVIYYVILITHIILAIGMLPPIFIAVNHAVKGRYERHRLWVKWAYPIWLYVSITGVLVYFMLYQWFLPPAPETTVTAPPAAPVAEQPTEPDDSLVYEPEIYEYEAEAGQKEMTAVFVAKNPGTTPVTLTQLESSCTCLSVEADVREIPPGGEARITAVFDIAKLSGEAEKSLYVKTDRGGARETRLAVRVSIPAIVSLDPMTVKWAIGEEATPREIRFKVLREKPIRVTEATSSRDSVRATLETIEEGREYRITLVPESTDSTLLGFVRIVTDCELEQYQRQLAYYAIHDEPAGVN